MAKRKPKEPITCAFCGRTEPATRVTRKGTYMESIVSNFVTVARGLIACHDCYKVHDSGRKSRASNISKLKDLPITSPQWGKFLDSRKS